MAWSVLQSVGGLGSGASTIQTYTSNVSAGTKLIAYFSAFSAGSFTVTSVKDGAGNTFTQVGFLYSATSQTGTGIFAMDTPAGDVGTKPVITALISNGSFGAMVIQEVSGLAVGNTLAAMADGTAASTGFAAGASHAQPAYSSTAANEFLVSFCGDQGGPQTMTQPAGYTLDAHAVNNNASADCCPAYKNSAGGAESGTWSYSGSTVGSNIAVVAFQLAAAGGGGGPAPQPVQPGRTWLRRFRHPQQPPAAAPVIPVAGPPVRALSGPVRARFPQYQRGICRAIRSSAPPAVAGTPVRSSENPVRASWPAARGGRTASRSGTFTFVSLTSGPPVYPWHGPVEARRLPQRGGTTSSRTGAYGRTGPPVKPATGPVRAQPAAPRGGSVTRRAGTFTAVALTSGPPVYPLGHPAQARRQPQHGGSVTRRAGVYQGSGPQVPALKQPLGQYRRQPPPPARGRVASLRGTPQGTGPAVPPLHRPVRARLPGPFRAGRTRTTLLPPVPTPPPAFTIGTLTAGGAPAAVLTAAGASSTLTAATTAAAALTAGDKRTGGPGG